MDKLIGILAKKKGYKALSGVMKHQRTREKLIKNWNFIFGGLADSLSFSFLKTGVLTVDTSNPLWVSEIKYYEKKLLETISEVFHDKKMITSIRVRYQKKKIVLKKDDLPSKKLSFEEKIKYSNKSHHIRMIVLK